MAPELRFPLSTMWDIRRNCAILLLWSLSLLVLVSGSYAASRSSPCPTDGKYQPEGRVVAQTLHSGSTERSFYLCLPSDYENKRTEKSLILSFHGGTRTALDQFSLDRIISEPTNDFIVVYPQGIDNTWQGVPGVKTDDLKFIRDLLDHLSKEYRVNRTRIYATGKSDGAGFVGQLACDPNLSKRIAAFASVSGAFYTTVSSEKCHPDTVPISCKPGRRSIPLIEFHGREDDTIPYNGGSRRDGCLPSIPHYLANWASLNNQPTSKKSSRLTKDTNVIVYGNGIITAYLDKSIGHDWPSTTSNYDNSRPGHVPATYDATPIILDWFAKHSLQRINKMRI